MRRYNSSYGFHTAGGNNADYTLVQGVWYTACVVFSGSPAIPVLYVNGTVETWEISASVNIPSGDCIITLGGEKEQTWNNQRGFSIDDFRVFNESLSSTQVADLDAQTPYLHYTFDNAHRDGMYKVGPYADNSGKTDDSAMFEAVLPIALSEEIDGSWVLPLHDTQDNTNMLVATYPLEHSNNRVKCGLIC